MKESELPKNKAVELFEKFNSLTHGYVGSSMLSNFEFPDSVIKNKAECAAIVIDEILKYGYNDEYWNEVKTQLKSHVDKLLNEYYETLKSNE